jgi:protein-arginine kinase activator protein McsA
MVLTRARGAQAIAAKNYPLAIQHAEQGIEKIRAFFNDIGHAEAAEHSGEIQSLENWLDELRSKRPVSQRERLERALQEAVQREDYERAARVRDALKKLAPSE